MKIIFLDIDGPLIPLRMYFSGGRPFNKEAGSFIYDPVAIGMVNHLCQKFDAQIVFNTAHNENPDHIMRHQGTYNGLQHLHPEECTTKFVQEIGNRYDAITDWIERHSDEYIVDWIVIDDMEVYLPKQVKVDYSLGMIINDYYRACELFGEKQSLIVGVGQTYNNKD